MYCIFQSWEKYSLLAAAVKLFTENIPDISTDCVLQVMVPDPNNYPGITSIMTERTLLIQGKAATTAP